jgi:soluble lytic murein transglycosylase-like protein
MLMLVWPLASWATVSGSAQPLDGAAPSPESAEAGGATPPETKPARPAFAVPPDRPRPSRSEVQAMIPEVAKRHGVEEALVKAVVAAESNYNAHAVSRAGAVGLMQLMPPTAADYGVTSVADLFDPKINLNTGTRHLKRLLNKYKNDYGRVIMAYNAGEGVVDRTNSQVTYLETLNYTEAVINNYRRNGGAQPTQVALNQVRTLRGTRDLGQARRLMKKYLDPSLLSLKVKPTLDLRRLNPALHDVGPESKPMFELGATGRP